MLQEPKIEIAKAITLEEHVSHAGSHLGRAQRHLQTLKEHHAEIGNYGGFAKAEGAGHNPHVVHHMVKAAEHLGRTDEQQKMATRHLNALTGNSDYGENQTYKAGEKAAHDAGLHLTNAAEHLSNLAEHSVAPIGETSQEAEQRKTMAAHHHKKMGEHLDAASDKLQAARSELDASLHPEDAQVNNNPTSPPKTVPDVQQAAKGGPLSIVQATTETPKENLSIFKTDDGGTGFRMFIPIQKMEEAVMKTAAGPEVKGLLVKGWGSVSEYKDSQGDIISADGLIDAVQGERPDAYNKWGNIRDMHKSDAIGAAPVIEIRQHPVTKSPAMWIEAFIVDPLAISKFLAKVYKGFSIGGRCLEAEPLEAQAA